MNAYGRFRLPAALAVSALIVAPAVRAEPLHTVAVTGAQPMTLAEIATLVETQVGKPVKITLSPDHEYLRSDAGRRLSATWNGPLSPFLDAVTKRFGLQWREDGPAIQIFDDARSAPVLPTPMVAVAAAPMVAGHGSLDTAVAARSAPTQRVRSTPSPMPAEASAVISAAPRLERAFQAPSAPGAQRASLPTDVLRQAAGDWAGGDHGAAVEKWTVLAREDNPDALFNLGQAARLGRGLKQDSALAVDLYQRAAALGQEKASAFLSRLTEVSNRTNGEAADVQRPGLWAIHLGMYDDMDKAIKSLSRILKRASLSGFPVRISPIGPDYEVTVEQLTPAFATQTCQRLARKGNACRVLNG